VHTVDLSEIYAKRSRNPTKGPSYYAHVERNFTFGDFLCRYYVRIYDRNNTLQGLVASTFVATKWGAVRWAKRWVSHEFKDREHASRNKESFYIDLDA
jgi:hypothetical protein